MDFKKTNIHILPPPQGSSRVEAVYIPQAIFYFMTQITPLAVDGLWKQQVIFFQLERIFFPKIFSSLSYF